MSAISALERVVSIRIIQEDAESIYSLITTERDAVFSLGIIPYYALFVQSCKEYCKFEEDADEIITKVKDIRNHIKGYADSFGKSKKKVSAIDHQEDEQFKSQLRFDFMKSWNIHYNLGTYWTDDRHIVGNTQQLAAFVGINDFSDTNRNQKAYDLSYYIGSIVSSVRNGISSTYSIPHIERRNSGTSIRKYCDLNTNIKHPFFFSYDNKELNLFLLHLLCNMNFVKHILKPMLTDDNSWAFRVEYIVTYYTYRALQRLKNYAENNADIPADTAELEDILLGSEGLFETKFRNCMMHYGLDNQGVLSEEFIEKPFYGMIETCFNGMDFESYREKLHTFSESIITYLESKFDSNPLELEEL